MKQSTTTGRTKGKRSTSNSAVKNRSGSRPTADRENNSVRGNNGESRSKDSNSRSDNSSSGDGSPTNSSSGSGFSGSRTADAFAGAMGVRSSSKQEPRTFSGESPLEKFFLAQLKDIYYVENKIIQSLPKMQEAATTEELKDAFEDHLLQTQRHVKRLEKVFECLGRAAAGEECEAIEGIVREAESIIGETQDGTLTRDAALIIAAQKVEHYEIASYGGLVQLAITMRLHDAVELLDKTLIEEEDTDALLTEIAENEINLRAEHEGSGEQQEDNEEQEAEGGEGEGNENQR